MQTENKRLTKEELLKDIEALLSYSPNSTTTINPNYLEYLEHEDLESIKENLIKKIGVLKEEDKVWLEQFKKHD